MILLRKVNVQKIIKTTIFLSQCGIKKICNKELEDFSTQKNEKTIPSGEPVFPTKINEIERSQTLDSKSL